jgi:hypothetical protein
VPSVPSVSASVSAPGSAGSASNTGAGGGGTGGGTGGGMGIGGGMGMGVGMGMGGMGGGAVALQSGQEALQARHAELFLTLAIQYWLDTAMVMRVEHSKGIKPI